MFSGSTMVALHFCRVYMGKDIDTVRDNKEIPKNVDCLVLTIRSLYLKCSSHTRESLIKLNNASHKCIVRSPKQL